LAVVVMVAVFLAAPSAMAKKQLAEDELELITAAGQPKVLETDGAGSPITFTDSVMVAVAFDTNVQLNLTALTLNNVAGENQLATGINIQTSAASDQAPQTITITQSWGSVKDQTAIFGPASPATICQSASAKCGIGINKATSAPAKGVLLSMYGDDILSTIGAGSSITALQNPEFDLTFGSGVQQALAALVVNNVVGINQVATGVNIEAGFVNTLPGVTVGQAGGSTAPGAAQTIAIDQWRGMPKGSRPTPGF